MANAFSMDLRKRIVADCDAGMTVRAVADKFQVTDRVIFKLLERRRETGSIAPLKGKVGRKRKLELKRDEIIQAVNNNSSLTLQELISELDLPVSVSTLWKSLKRWGISLKKSPSRE